MGKSRGRAVVGLAVGAAGAYLLAKAYARARAKCPPFSRRVYTDGDDLIEDLRYFWENPEDLGALRTNPRIDRAFAGRVMLAVTGVNGCRYCSYAHARYALRQGLSEEEVRSLLQGQLETATVDEAPALMFAQHYAESGGDPDAETVQRLIEEYGAGTARDLINLIRLIMLGNLVGNTFDALLSRLLGRPSPDTTLADELSVLATFFFGVVPLMPWIVLRGALVPAEQESIEIPLDTMPRLGEQ